MLNASRLNFIDFPQGCDLERLQEKTLWQKDWQTCKHAGQYQLSCRQASTIDDGKCTCLSPLMLLVCLVDNAKDSVFAFHQQLFAICSPMSLAVVAGTKRLPVSNHHVLMRIDSHVIHL